MHSSCVSRREVDLRRGRSVCYTRLLRFRRFGGVLIAALLLLPAGRAGAQDGRALLMQALKAYHALQSYECTSSVSTLFLFKGKPIQQQSVTTDMKVKRPSKLKLTLSQPRGTVIVTSDGTNLIVYDTTANQYTRGPAAPTMESLLPLLVQRAQILAALDPLYFFSRSDLPKELVTLKAGKPGTVNGRSVVLVEGVQRSPARLLKTKSGQTLLLPAETRNWKWWIDSQTHLLAKVETETRNLHMKVNVRQGKKVMPRQLAVTNQLRYIISQSQPNISLPDSVFAFTPPAGATEFKHVAGVLKGGK